MAYFYLFEIFISDTLTLCPKLPTKDPKIHFHTLPRSNLFKTYVFSTLNPFQTEPELAFFSDLEAYLLFPFICTWLYFLDPAIFSIRSMCSKIIHWGQCQGTLCRVKFVPGFKGVILKFDF